MERRRILVLEDDEVVRDAVTMMLTADSYDVFGAGNRAEALRLLEQGPYDAIVSDLRIHNLDGRRLYRELTERWPEAVRHLIFMTGYAPEYADFLREAGVPVLAKPFSPETLRRAVERAIAAA